MRYWQAGEIPMKNWSNQHREVAAKLIFTYLSLCIITYLSYFFSLLQLFTAALVLNLPLKINFAFFLKRPAS